MSLVSGFAHDLFVSYAHFDNEEDSTGVRWVSRFQVDLKNALRQRLGEDPEIFFDSRSFEASDHVDFLIENARSSAVFVALFSPSYIAREFTIRELEAFCGRTPAANPVVVVELLPVDENRHPSLLVGRKRTPFWWRDRTEQDIPLRLTSKFNPELYNERLQVLAHQIKRLLTDERSGGQPSIPETPSPQPQLPVRLSAPAAEAPQTKKTVLLAQSTDDLFDECERVRACLEQFGMKVLPENDFPQGGNEFAAAFEQDLARAGLFVQLLGNFGSRKPPDLPHTYAQYQYETAKSRGLKILQWRRPDLDLAAVSHRDKPLMEGPEVLAVGLEEFRSEILRACTPEPLKPAPAAAAEDGCHVFINADRSDKELADALLKVFENKASYTAARPLFEGSAKDIVEDLEANLLNCGALLMLYGSAPPAWVRAQLLRYSKLERQRDAPPRLKSIVLGPPVPKPDLAWSGGFRTIDCQSGDIAQQIQSILAGLQL
jgi:hypothetical protein